ncbi:MAG: hemolysin III family protein [Rhodococcus sp. (in: high G+C Gram-positive bacteria)]
MTMFGIDELPVKPRMRGWIHLYAFGFAVVSGIVLVSLAFSLVSVSAGIASAVYAVTVCGVFGVSATYHRVNWSKPSHRVWMKRADHSMIFVFIAGSYTPFAVLGLPASTGRTLLIVVWLGALGGVALKMLWPQSPRWVGVPLYLLLGWAIVPVAPTLIDHVGWAPFVLLLVGGILYSIGAVLYATQWPNPWPTTFGHHEFFHAATVLAAICHLVAVWLVVF